MPHTHSSHTLSPLTMLSQVFLLPLARIYSILSASLSLQIDCWALPVSLIRLKAYLAWHWWTNYSSSVDSLTSGSFGSILTLFLLTSGAAPRGLQLRRQLICDCNCNYNWSLGGLVLWFAGSHHSHISQTHGFLFNLVAFRLLLLPTTRCRLLLLLSQKAFNKFAFVLVFGFYIYILVVFVLPLAFYSWLMDAILSTAFCHSANGKRRS